MPVFSAWVEKASDKAKRMFLSLWFISLFIPYLTEFVSRYQFGTCSWNSFGLFYYFAGFNGYLLLGHYLGKKTEGALGKILLMTIPLFLVGYFITWAGFRYMTSDPNVSEEGMELFFTYCSPNCLVDDGGRFPVGTKSTDHLAGYLPCPCQSDQMRFWLVLRALFFCRSFLYVRTVDRDTCSGVGSCFGCSYLYLFMVIYLSGE